MKKSFKIIVFLLLAVPVIFTGCKKTELTDNSQNAKENSLKSVAYCGATSTANLYAFESTVVKYGTVTVGNDANNLYVTYTLEPGWFFMPANVTYFDGCYLYVGTKSEVEAQYTVPPTPNVVYPDGTGHFNYSLFPNRYTPVAPGETSHQFIIPRSGIKEDCPIIVAFAGITNGEDKKVVSARSLLKGPGFWFTHCMQTCGHGSGTVYAFGTTAAQAQCFITMTGSDNPNSNNWGWTNKIGPGTYNWPIYAGAGQCDITKGALVGSLHVVYIPPTVTIKYNMAPGVSLGGTHVSVYMNPQMLPKNKKGQYITAPGQFPYSGNPVTVNGLSGEIWIAAHSGATW